MNSLTLHTSNRLENLMDALAETARTPLSDPFKPDVILVQSRGMEHWISMGLAKQHGICCNVQFPFPNAFLEDLFRSIAQDFHAPSPFDPGPLTFRLFSLLAKEKIGTGPLGAYLEGDPTGLKRYQLAARIADRFDQYQIYRPDLIVRWDEGVVSGGSDELWQQRLWAEVTEKNDEPNRSARYRMLIDRLASGDIPVDRLPERLSVFGISYLPPFYLEVLAALSQRIPVHLFFLNPTMEFWGDILSERERRRVRKHYGETADEDLHLDAGNRLLASLGIQGKAFFSLAVSMETDTVDHYEEPGQDCLLNAVQRNILFLDTGDIREVKTGASTKGDNMEDDSIQVHSCHSPLREIEVLHDQLTAIFERYSDIDPSDVLVMTPDIERYAPFIQAVFDVETDSRKRIPYAIADRGFQGAFRLAEDFLNLLELRDARMTVTQVMGVLESKGIRDRFGLTEADLEPITGWITEARIRWGIDAKARYRLGLPETGENTWQAGLDRLLLGYAMSPRSVPRAFAGIFPAGGVEGGDAPILGRFLEFIQTLFAFFDLLKHSHSLGKWADILNNALETFWRFSDPEEPVAQRIRGFLEDLTVCQTVANCREPVTLEIVKAFLADRMAADRHSGGFVSGRVTFCAMLPMRSIPAEVICLVGMDGDRFPREDRTPGFDLISRNPRPGDRSRRNDDRYLFLEAILSARRCLYVSYVGKSIRDNADLPPSVLVSELLDYVSEGYGITAENFVVQHRLQAWSPAYFDARSSRLFSFSDRQLKTAQSLMAGRSHPEPPEPFWQSRLPDPDEEWKTLDIDTLCLFFANTCRFFAQQRLGVFLPGERVEDDREPFSVDGLDRFELGTEMIAQMAAGNEPESFYDQSRKEGRLPHGRPGKIGFFDLWSDAENMVSQVRGLSGDSAFQTIEADIRIDGFTLVGNLNFCMPQGQVLVRYAKMRASALLSAWIRHLTLCCTDEPGDIRKQTFLIARDETIRLMPVSDATVHLKSLLGWFWKGLGMPLPLYPNAAYEFARRVLVRSEAPESALERAGALMIGNDFRPGDLDDPYIALCTRGREILDREFQETVLNVFEPIFRHQERIN